MLPFDFVYVITLLGIAGLNSFNRCRCMFFVRKAHKHLPQRPIGKEHNEVVLGCPTRMLTNLVERGAGQQKIGRDTSGCVWLTSNGLDHILYMRGGSILVENFPKT